MDIIIFSFYKSLAHLGKENLKGTKDVNVEVIRKHQVIGSVPNTRQRIRRYHSRHRQEQMAQAVATPVTPSLSLICNSSSSLFKSKKPTSSVSFSTFGPPKVGGLSIRCARVGGVEIPNNKRVQYSLQYIHGIGRTRALEILNDLQMENKITKDLSEDELITLRDQVSKYMIEGDLRRFNALAIRRLKEIQCYRGIRHIQGLPCRGQRTKNNCRTLKGKKVAIAGKKKAPR